MIRGNTIAARILFALAFFSILDLLGAKSAASDARPTRIRAGSGQTIVSVRANPAARPSGTAAVLAGEPPPPRPRLVGFSPLVAIATSDEGKPLGADFEFEHVLENSYVGSLLNPAASPNFVVGFLDSGADVNLVAGSAATTLGLFGSNVTGNPVSIGGVGGSADAFISMPLGFFSAGLSAIRSGGTLDFDALVGHSTVCGLVAPAIDCGTGEVVTAVMGMPFMAFHDSIIRVDSPRTVRVGGVTYSGPDVTIQRPFLDYPFELAGSIAMEFGGLSPSVTTANYFPDFTDILNEPEPIIPTLLSFVAGSLPTGGSFFATVLVREGSSSSDNPVQPMRALVDTGAQSSIISRAMAANLSLPFEPDFTVAVCGVGGLVEGVPGYYIDFVKINAFGGALEFSRAPFVVIDLPSPEGRVLDGILGMNFFWNRNVIFEPAIALAFGGSSFLHFSEPIDVPFGDFDVDLEVDRNDAAILATCLTGPGAGMVNPECDPFDRLFDLDVDLKDLAGFQNCFSGDGVIADPACGQ